jgi:hypothetical protein
MKIKDKPTRLNVIIDSKKFYKLVLVKFRNLKFLVPSIVEFIIDDELTNGKISEV